MDFGPLPPAVGDSASSAWARVGISHLLRLHLRLRTNLLKRADDHPVIRLEPRADHPQAVVLERPGRHEVLLDLVLRIHHVDILPVLIRPDGAIDHQQRRMRLPDRQPNPHEHPRR